MNREGKVRPVTTSRLPREQEKLTLLLAFLDWGVGQPVTVRD